MPAGAEEYFEKWDLAAGAARPNRREARPRAFPFLFFISSAAVMGIVPPAHCASATDNQKTLSFTAYSSDGRLLSTQELFRYISPKSPENNSSGDAHGLYVTDPDDNPVAGRPWWDLSSDHPRLLWKGSRRIKISLPWPVEQDGFSTVYADKEGSGYSDGESIFLNEEIAVTEYRLFRGALQDRRSVWQPTYKPGREFLQLQRNALEAVAKAHAGKTPRERAMLYEKALTQTSLAWSKMLFEHGAQIAADRRTGPSLRWGLTLDETLIDRLSEEKKILHDLKASGATWVRLVFRLNPDDVLYDHPRSFNEYDALIADLTGMKIHVMASVLDSAFWPKDMPPNLLAHRTRNLVMHYKDTIRSWEVASEVNGNWLGGYKHPLPDETILKAFTSAASAVKEIDPSLETVATLYWWEGTAGDDAHPLFAWLNHALPKDPFKNIDAVGLSIYPDNNPMGLAFDPVFQRLGRFLPNQRLMVGEFGYVEGNELKGYWWLDPKEIDAARKDLVILYAGAACAIPRSVGGGFWWSALTQMLGDDRRSKELLKAYHHELSRLQR